MVTTPPEGLRGLRVKPDTIKLVWRPDRIALVVFQLKAGDGEWFALGQANPTMESYTVGDINPTITYTIRARKEFGSERSTWTEVVVPPLNSNTPASAGPTK